MATICTKNYLRSHRIHRDIADFIAVLFKAREPCPKMQNKFFGPKGRIILHVWASGTCPNTGYSCPTLRYFSISFLGVDKSTGIYSSQRKDKYAHLNTLYNGDSRVSYN